MMPTRTAAWSTRLRTRAGTALLATATMLVATAGVAFAADINEPITPGTTLANAPVKNVVIDTPGEIAYYTFNVSAADVAAQRVVTAQLTDVVGIASTRSIFSITGSDGTSLENSYIGNFTYVSNPVTSPGTYTIQLNPYDVATGTARLKVIKPVDSSTPITPGTTLAATTAINVSITQPGQKANYTLNITKADVTAGRVITAQLTDVVGIASTRSIFSITGSDGTSLENSYIGNFTYVSNPVTSPGTYTIQLNPYDVATGTARLKVIKPVDSSTPITPGTTLAATTAINVSITQPGQKANYTLNITNADVTAGRVITAQLTDVVGIASTRSIFSITGSDGTSLENSYIGNFTYVSNPVTSPGTYTIQLNPYDVATGTARLKVIKPVDVSGAVTPGTALPTAAAKRVTITEPGQKAKYTFNVTAADVSAGRVIAAQLTDTVGIASTNSSFLITTSNGTVLENSYIGNFTYLTSPVTVTGVYTVQLNPYDVATGSTNLRVAKQLP